MTKKHLYDNLPWEEIYHDRNENNTSLKKLSEKYNCSKSHFYTKYKDFLKQNNLKDYLNKNNKKNDHKKDTLTPPLFKQIKVNEKKEKIHSEIAKPSQEQPQGKKKIDQKIHIQYNDISITIQEDSDLEKVLKVIRNLLNT